MLTVRTTLATEMNNDNIKKKVIVWTAPRSLSTAFYHSISTLKKTKHFLELFTGAHQFGPDRCTTSYPVLPADFEIPSGLVLERVATVNDLTYDMMKTILTADYPDMDLVFSKECACCLPKVMWGDMVSGRFTTFTHTFLIRDPERVMYSNYKAPKLNPGVYPPGGGLFELYEFYEFIKEKKGSIPVVVDAADLQAHPGETMKSYCEAVGIQFDPNMTFWEKGFTSPFTYTIWGDEWIMEHSQTSGFIKIKPEEQMPVPLDQLPSDVVKCIEDSRAHYKALQRDCIKLSSL